MPILLNGSSRGGVGSLIGGWAKGLDRPSGNPVGRYIQEVAARSTPLGLLGAAASEAKRFMGMPTGELAGEFAGGGVGATAYHGSPHQFDKFKKEAIGTGEGAQAYSIQNPPPPNTPNRKII